MPKRKSDGLTGPVETKKQKPEQKQMWRNGLSGSSNQLDLSKNSLTGRLSKKEQESLFDADRSFKNNPKNSTENTLKSPKPQEPISRRRSSPDNRQYRASLKDRAIKRERQLKIHAATSLLEKPTLGRCLAERELGLSRTQVRMIRKLDPKHQYDSIVHSRRMNNFLLKKGINPQALKPQQWNALYKQLHLGTPQSFDSAVQTIQTQLSPNNSSQPPSDTAIELNATTLQAFPLLLATSVLFIRDMAAEELILEAEQELQREMIEEAGINEAQNEAMANTDMMDISSKGRMVEPLAVDVESQGINDRLVDIVKKDADAVDRTTIIEPKSYHSEKHQDKVGDRFRAHMAPDNTHIRT